MSPTVSALLGLPVSREAHGVFIDDAMALLDPTTLLLHYKVIMMVVMVMVIVMVMLMVTAMMTWW